MALASGFSYRLGTRTLNRTRTRIPAVVIVCGTLISTYCRRFLGGGVTLVVFVVVIVAVALIVMVVVGVALAVGGACISGCDVLGCVSFFFFLLFSVRQSIAVPGPAGAIKLALNSIN